MAYDPSDVHAWLTRAVALLSDSLGAWEDEEHSVQEEHADHIADLNKFFDDYMASKVEARG